jgi:hypothetical protein
MGNYITSLPLTVVHINQPQIDRFHNLTTEVAELIDDATHVDHDLARATLINMGQKLANRLRNTTEKAELDLQHAQRVAHCNVISEVNRLALTGEHEMIAEAIVAMQAPDWEPESSDDLLLDEYITHLRTRQLTDGISLYVDLERCLQFFEERICNYHCKVHATSYVAA